MRVRLRRFLSRPYASDELGMGDCVDVGSAIQVWVMGGTSGYEWLRIHETTQKDAYEVLALRHLRHQPVNDITIDYHMDGNVPIFDVMHVDAKPQVVKERTSNAAAYAHIAAFGIF